MSRIIFYPSKINCPLYSILYSILKFSDDKKKFEIFVDDIILNNVIISNQNQEVRPICDERNKNGAHLDDHIRKSLPNSTVSFKCRFWCDLSNSRERSKTKEINFQLSLNNTYRVVNVQSSVNCRIFSSAGNTTPYDGMSINYSRLEARTVPDFDIDLWHQSTAVNKQIQIISSITLMANAITKISRIYGEQSQKLAPKRQQ
ncbi:uncharacterized protein BX664DRAFT_345997 [Halteromyces radiatus]|uniref:uncharacterized protein n=1 Tax=Halteromyces radiatus TaxID=101107 RepID=UPI00221E7FB0|nr:uncharacterized protein BX664DRAFT_345997 [Halteromyces radiatus]KAI8099963.1 hypothetical protein BX664DRAFT_345997 [Halteromyces radiatus]